MLVYCSCHVCCCAAGVFCAVVSHPADTIVSKLNQQKGSSFIQVGKNLGMLGKPDLWAARNSRWEAFRCCFLIISLSFLWFVYFCVLQPWKQHTFYFLIWLLFTLFISCCLYDIYCVHEWIDAFWEVWNIRPNMLKLPFFCQCLHDNFFNLQRWIFFEPLSLVHRSYVLDSATKVISEVGIWKA